MIIAQAVFYGREKINIFDILYSWTKLILVITVAKRQGERKD